MSTTASTTAVRASVRTTLDPHLAEALADVERWLKIRQALANDERDALQVDSILRESSKAIAAFDISGNYDVQFWVLERLSALRSGLESVGVETTELSTTIHHRIKALVSAKVVLQKIQACVSKTAQPLPVFAIKICNDLFNSDLDATQYYLGLNIRDFSYDLWKKGKMDATYDTACVAVPLQELENVYAPWPNAILFGVELKNKTTITLEMRSKTDAEGLIGHLRAVIAMEHTFGSRRSIAPKSQGTRASASTPTYDDKL